MKKLIILFLSLFLAVGCKTGSSNNSSRGSSSSTSSNGDVPLPYDKTDFDQFWAHLDASDNVAYAIYRIFFEDFDILINEAITNATFSSDFFNSAENRDEFFSLYDCYYDADLESLAAIYLSPEVQEYPLVVELSTTDAPFLTQLIQWLQLTDTIFNNANYNTSKGAMLEKTRNAIKVQYFSPTVDLFQKMAPVTAGDLHLLDVETENLTLITSDSDLSNLIYILNNLPSYSMSIEDMVETFLFLGSTYYYNDMLAKIVGEAFLEILAQSYRLYPTYPNFLNSNWDDELFLSWVYMVEFGIIALDSTYTSFGTYLSFNIADLDIAIIYEFTDSLIFNGYYDNLLIPYYDLMDFLATVDASGRLLTAEEEAEVTVQLTNIFTAIKKWITPIVKYEVYYGPFYFDEEAQQYSTIPYWSYIIAMLDLYDAYDVPLLLTGADSAANLKDTLLNALINTYAANLPTDMLMYNQSLPSNFTQNLSEFQFISYTVNIVQDDPAYPYYEVIIEYKHTASGTTYYVILADNDDQDYCWWAGTVGLPETIANFDTLTVADFSSLDAGTKEDVTEACYFILLSFIFTLEGESPNNKIVTDLDNRTTTVVTNADFATLLGL